MKIRLPLLTRREMMKRAAIILEAASSPLSSLAGSKKKSLKEESASWRLIRGNPSAPAGTPHRPDQDAHSLLLSLIPAIIT